MNMGIKMLAVKKLKVNRRNKPQTCAHIYILQDRMNTGMYEQNIQVSKHSNGHRAHFYLGSVLPSGKSRS